MPPGMEETLRKRKEKLRKGNGGMEAYLGNKDFWIKEEQLMHSTRILENTRYNKPPVVRRQRDICHREWRKPYENLRKS